MWMLQEDYTVFRCLSYSKVLVFSKYHDAYGVMKIAKEKETNYAPPGVTGQSDTMSQVVASDYLISNDKASWVVEIMMEVGDT